MMERALVLLRLSIRNVRRQVRRSVLTGLAMALGVAVLAFSRALSDGAHGDWVDTGVRLGAGHVAFQHPRFQASRNLNDRLSPSAVARARQALAVPEVARDVRRVAPRLEVQGLANSATAAVPVLVSGVDPGVEAGFSQLADRIADGRYLEAGDRLQAVIGARLAERLDLTVGSRLVLTAQDAAGEIAGQFVRVAGIYRTGLPEADEGLVQVPLSLAQEWLGVGDALTTLAVLVESSWAVPDVLRRLRAAAGPSDALRVLGWREAMPQLDAAIKIDDWGGYVFLVLLFIIIALAIVNTVLMSVLYRTREFGVLRALGLSKLQTSGVVFGEAVFLTALSGTIGMLVGFGVTWLFFRNGLDYSALIENDFTFSGVVLDPVVIPKFRVAQVVQTVSAVAAIGVLSAIYPAWRASRIDMANAMKFEA